MAYSSRAPLPISEQRIAFDSVSDKIHLDNKQKSTELAVSHRKAEVRVRHVVLIRLRFGLRVCKVLILLILGKELLVPKVLVR